MELQHTEVGLYLLQLLLTMSTLGGGGRAYRGVSLLVIFVCACACVLKCVCHRQARLCVSHTTIIHSHELHHVHALGAEVTVHVYDLSPVNQYSYEFGVGVFHSGVEVHAYTSRLVDYHSHSLKMCSLQKPCMEGCCRLHIVGDVCTQPLHTLIYMF